ncbi:hypothetical protein Droror1_Dr00007393 [Drosera rotundifolia]
MATVVRPLVSGDEMKMRILGNLNTVSYIQAKSEVHIRLCPTKKGSAINAFSKTTAREEPNIHGGQSYISFQKFSRHNKDYREKPMLMDQQGINGNSHYLNVESQ